VRLIMPGVLMILEEIENMGKATVVGPHPRHVAISHPQPSAVTAFVQLWMNLQTLCPHFTST
jgi:hypothetical protein